MKNAVYISAAAKNDYAGVDKKISQQIDVMSSFFNMHHIIIKKAESSLLKSVLWRMPFGSYGRVYEDAVRELSEIPDIAFVYIRDMFWDRRYYGFIKQVRKIAGNAKIVLEIPAYPYANEFLHSLTMWPYYFKDVLYKRHTHELIDRIVTYSPDDKIFGVPTIRTMNGYKVDDVKLADDYEYTDTLKLVAVASMQIHHGYERVIKGLRDYYDHGGNRDVKLYLVGTGDRTRHYEELTKKLSLEDHVVFCGRKTGKDLEDMFHDADVGLGSFGFHSIGDEDHISSTLKTREYLAYGIPFASACTEDVFMDDPDCEFYRHYPDDDTDVDVGDIIEMYDALKGKYSKTELRKHIHEYAKKKIDMSAVMQPIIDYITKTSYT